MRFEHINFGIKKLTELQVSPPKVSMNENLKPVDFKLQTMTKENTKVMEVKLQTKERAVQRAYFNYSVSFAQVNWFNFRPLYE